MALLSIVQRRSFGLVLTADASNDSFSEPVDSFGHEDLVVETQV